MAQTPPPCTPSGISICLPVPELWKPAGFPPNCLSRPTPPRPPSHGAVALSSNLLAMRASILTMPAFLVIITNGACGASSIMYACLEEGQHGTASGPCKPPSRHAESTTVALATACQGSST